MSHKTLLYCYLFTKWKHINLIKSPKWKNCNILIDNRILTVLPSEKDYMIELKYVHNEYDYKPILTLYINDMIYYEYNRPFNLNIFLEVNTPEINDIVKYIDIISNQKPKLYSYHRCQN
jgi:hypothetical protein